MSGPRHRLGASSALLAAAALAAACATTPPRPRPDWPTTGSRVMHPTEVLIVRQGESTVPMQVVKNDQPGGDAFLRTPAAAADPSDPALPDLLARLHATVLAEEGVGIAAPQVGVSRRVVLVKRLDREPDQPFEAYLNPVIRERATETVIDWEGCLSVPAGFGQVERPAWIALAYDTPGGEHREERVEGFTARIFQHEIDHLDGVLFVDRKLPGALMPKDEYREMRARERGEAPPATE